MSKIAVNWLKASRANRGLSCLDYSLHLRNERKNLFVLNSFFIYYFNVLKTKIYHNYIIKYDNTTFSEYFCKQRYYCGKKTLTADQANLEIFQRIVNGEPLMIARYGSVEVYNMMVFDLKYTPKYSIALNTLTNNAGFFPLNKELVPRYISIMKEASSNVDILAFWNMFREDYYIRKLMKDDVKLIPLRFLEPWFSSNPWTKALKGKRVLVIHPFAETIEKQYKNREKLFINSDILPEFQLLTLKAIQSIGGKCEEFNTWFDALDFMFEEAMKIEFDIALIGCGAYGMPLASKIKSSGKQAIHMGGVLQILFGIKGSRWDTDPIVSKMYNDFWVRPDEKEKPKMADSIEDGCYW